MEGLTSFDCFFQVKKFGPSCFKEMIISFDGILNIRLASSTFYVNMLTILPCVTWLLVILKHYYL